MESGEVLKPEPSKTKETAAARRIIVDPAVGATIQIQEAGRPPVEARQEWGKIPRIRIRGPRPAAVITHTAPDAALGSSLIPDSRVSRFKFNRAVTALDRGDASEDGTRSMVSVDREIPGRLVCYSGLGVVKAEGKRVAIDPPRSTEPVSQHMDVGTKLVDADGVIWKERSDAPFGAYETSVLDAKVRATQQFGQEFGPRVVAAGHYDGTNMGWMIYDMPGDVLSPIETLALELKLPAEYQGTLYGQAVEQQFRQIRQLHDKNVVHYQLHPGNWYVRFATDGNAQATFTDWETATDVSQLPPGSDFTTSDKFTRMDDGNKFFASLTPQQKAKALDLYTAFSSADLIQTEQFRSFIPLEEKGSLSVEQNSRRSLDYEILMFTHALAGYLKGTVDSEAIQKISQTLVQRYTPLALQGARINDIYLGDDLTFLAEQADYGTFAVNLGINELKLRLAKICASRPQEEVYQNLLAGGSLLDMPSLSIPAHL